MNEQEGFLEAILANPDDDQLRLIYADWLEERGDPRGEFIRVQMELAGTKPEPSREHELLVREKGLLASYEEEWLRPLRELLIGWKFQRGFLHEIEMDAKTFVKHAPAVFQAAPVRSLSIHFTGSLADELADCPYLNRLHKLGFATRGLLNSPQNVSEFLARTPHLSSLQSLTLPHHSLDLQGIRALAQAPALANLATLRLNFNDIGDLGLHAILGADHLGNLRRLHLARCGITNTGMNALARSGLLAQLEALELTHNDKIDSAGIRSLASSRRLGSLRSLWLGGLPINGLAILSLAQCKQLVGLTELDLSQTHIGDTGADALADSPHLENLGWLNLYKSRGITPMGKDRLLKRFGNRLVL
jgi:uncharacterized protein (TIGR02996 family)